MSNFSTYTLEKKLEKQLNVGVKHKDVTTIIDELKKRGLVEYQIDTKGRRKIWLTNIGLEQHQYLCGSYLKFFINKPG